MSTAPCSTCKTRVSTDAVMCPSCGNSPALSRGKTCGSCEHYVHNYDGDGGSWPGCAYDEDVYASKKACPAWCPEEDYYD